MLIGNKLIGGDNPCLIIAEIGQNHQGNKILAKEMINQCFRAGVDAVKLQKSNLDARFTRERLNKEYNSINSFGKTYGEHRQYLELSDQEFIELKNYAENLGLIFFASGMDIPSIDFLDRINVPVFKIGSGDTNNIELLEHVAKKNKPIILSTGMNDMVNVRKAYATIIKYNKKLCILQCTSAYPLPDNEVNLNVIKTYQNEFDAIIGYSGHEQCILISLGAVALGAKIIERHVTLNKLFKGTDHQASLNMDELKELCVNIRKIENALGSNEKTVMKSELACFTKLGKTIVAKRDIRKNTVLTKDDITVKVASNKGIDPIYYNNLLNIKIDRDYEEDEVIDKDNLRHVDLVDLI